MVKAKNNFQKKQHRSIGHFLLLKSKLISHSQATIYRFQRTDS